MKIEFENPIKRLSFLCRLTDTKIAWINSSSRSNYEVYVVILCLIMMPKLITLTEFILKNF